MSFAAEAQKRVHDLWRRIEDYSQGQADRAERGVPGWELSGRIDWWTPTGHVRLPSASRPGRRGTGTKRSLRLELGLPPLRRQKHPPSKPSTSGPAPFDDPIGGSTFAAPTGASSAPTPERERLSLQG